MNSKEVVSVAMMFASYPISRLVPIPIGAASLFSFFCAIFMNNLGIKKVVMFFYPLYFSIIYESIFLIRPIYNGLLETLPLPTLFYSDTALVLFWLFAYFEVGFTSLFGARKILKKIQFFERLGTYYD